VNKDNDQLSSLYQQTSNEQPSQSVDSDIIRLAKQQLGTNKHAYRQYLPYSMVASIGLIALLFHNFPQYYLSGIEPVEQELKTELKSLDDAPNTSSNQAPTSQWQYQDGARETLIRSKQHSAKASVLQPSKRQEQSFESITEKQRLVHLKRIKQLVLSNNKKQAIKEIAYYLENYSANSLPPEYLAIYQAEK